MRGIYYLCILFLSGWCITAQAQSTLEFTIKQLPLLEVNAGKDTTVLKGSQVRLGSSLTAKGGSGTYSYTWTPAAGLDKADVANPVATIDTTVVYTVTVNDGKGCSKASQVTLKVTAVTAIDPVTDALKLRIFPNPSSGTFYITTDVIIAERSIQIELFSVQGAKVYSSTINGNRKLNETIRLGQLSKGLYLLKLTGSKLNAAYKLVTL